MKSLIGLMGMVTLFVLSAPVRPERVSPAATPVVTSLVGAITVAQIPAWVAAGVQPLLAAHSSMIRLKAQQRVAQTFWPT